MEAEPDRKRFQVSLLGFFYLTAAIAIALSIGLANVSSFQATLDELPGETYPVFREFAWIWSVASGIAIAFTPIPDRSLRVVLVMFAIVALCLCIVNSFAPFGFFFPFFVPTPLL